MIRKSKLITTPAELNNRVRGFILDSQIQHAHELSVILGCTPISDELQEREEQESDKRIERLDYITPLIYAHAHLLAEGAIEYQKATATGEVSKLPNEIWVESRRTMEQVSMSAVMGSISQLIDMGLLTIPRRYKK
jgi:hypothetical protein